MLATAEEICGPYVWGVYDLLVLPPSFPYGGMENPCLTFVTPTLLVSDGVCVIAYVRVFVARPSNILRNEGRRSSSFWQITQAIFMLGKIALFYLPVTQNEPIFSISTSPNFTELTKLVLNVCVFYLL